MIPDTEETESQIGNVQHMSEFKKFFFILGAAIACGVGVAFLADEKLMRFIFMCGGVLIFGSCGFYSMLFIAKLIPSLEGWLIKREIIISATTKGFRYTDAAMLVILSSLSIYGFFLIVTSIRALFF